MKSTRQRRTEIQAQRAEKRALAKQDAAKAFQASLAASDHAHDVRRAKQRLMVSKQAWVNPANLRPTNSHGTPEFVALGYYTDKPFACKTCGAQELWTTAIQCKPCRRQAQARKREDRRNQGAP